MAKAYYGLICPTCNAGYPLGTENKRDWRYGIVDLPFLVPGTWELPCIRCGQISYSEDLLTWEPSESYTAAQMAVNTSHVRRVKQKPA